MKKILVNPTKLSAALIDYNERTKLMKKLDLIDRSDKNYIFKYILTFWLGSNPTLIRIDGSYLYFFFNKSTSIPDVNCSIITLDK